MDALDEVKAKARKLQETYPHRTEEIDDLVQLCVDEINNGESRANEIDHLEASLDEIQDWENEEGYE